MTEARSRLIVALDVPDIATARTWVTRLRGRVGWFKVGLELFVREGPGLVREIRGGGDSVFLDLKLHDIPNTVGAAVRSACRLGVQMLTLHAAGGPAMLAAAAEAAASAQSPPLLLAVTALTSLSERDLGKIGVVGALPVWVERLAITAWESGVRGLVSSAGEAPNLRRRFGQELRLVVPGIRPAGEQVQDQARVATPAEAIRLGADFLVVGRPILKAADPGGAADAIVEEIAAALR